MYAAYICHPICDSNFLVLPNICRHTSKFTCHLNFSLPDPKNSHCKSDVGYKKSASDTCEQPYINVKDKKLDLRITEPMQICIHRKDNSPKSVNHCLTLKEGPKVKSDIRRFPGHNILQVGFTLQTSKINNKRVISPFKFGCPRLTLKEGLKVKSDHIKRFAAHNFL